MTTPIRTQCPHCDAIFQLQQHQLNKADAKILCNQCSRGFVVNDNLILSSDNTHSNKVEHANTTDPSAFINASSVSHSLNGSAAESSDIISEYDSLDYMLENMEPWSKPVNGSASLLAVETPLASEPPNPSHATATATATAVDSMPSKAFSLEDEEALLDFDTDTDTEVAIKPSLRKSNTIKPNIAKSSATANNRSNDIDTYNTQTTSSNLSDNDANENAWLEQLLAEESEQDNLDQNDTDLSQLLIDMGVPFGEENDANDSFSLVAKPQDNRHSTQTHARSSVDMMLWSAGCLALLLLLLAQYVIFNVDTLMKDPDHAKRLQKICAVAACSLPNADLSQLALNDITHRASQIDTSGTFSDIQATLNNQSSQTQLLPNLKVSLYGSDRLIGAFIAAPDEYLLSPQKQLAAQGQKQLWFTVPIDNRQISTVTVEPIY